LPPGDSPPRRGGSARRLRAEVLRGAGRRSRRGGQEDGGGSDCAAIDRMDPRRERRRRGRRQPPPCRPRAAEEQARHPRRRGTRGDGAPVDRSTLVDPMSASGSRFTEEGEWQLAPDYIVSAEVTSEDPQIVTVQYNPDAVWETGDPITIEDLIAYSKALKGDDDAFQVASTVGWEQVKEVRQTDDEFTGEIEFDSPYADWITLVYPEFPHGISDDPEEFNKGYVDQNTPSNGPFKVDSIDNSGGVVTLTRNDKWWGRS